MHFRHMTKAFKGMYHYKGHGLDIDGVGPAAEELFSSLEKNALVMPHYWLKWTQTVQGSPGGCSCAKTAAYFHNVRNCTAGLVCCIIYYAVRISDVGATVNSNLSVRQAFLVILSSY